MLFGIQVELAQDKKSRKLLIEKKTGKAYLLQGKDDIWVHFFRMNIVNAFGIAFLMWQFAKLPTPYAIALGVAIYAVVNVYFNKKVLANMSVVKKYELKEKETKKPSVLPIVPILYYLIGGALLVCLFTGQVESGYLTYVVWGAITIATIMGTVNLMSCIKGK